MFTMQESASELRAGVPAAGGAVGSRPVAEKPVAAVAALPFNRSARTQRLLRVRLLWPLLAYRSPAHSQVYYFDMYSYLLLPIVVPMINQITIN